MAFSYILKCNNFLMVIDIGQKVLEVELNFKIPHGDVIFEVPKGGKTYKK